MSEASIGEQQLRVLYEEPRDLEKRQRVGKQHYGALAKTRHVFNVLK